MRAHSKSAIRRAGPVFQIVLALKSGPRPVGYFVMIIAGPRQTIRGLDIEVSENVVVWNVCSSLAPRAAFFDVEHVDRDVFGKEPLDPIEILSPDLDPLLRQTGNQIDTDVRESMFPQ